MSEVSITDLIARLRYEYESTNPYADASVASVMSLAADALENAQRTLEMDEKYINKLEAKVFVLESVTAPTETTGGAQLISAERTRQIEDEGYSASNDAGKAHALVDAAVAYAHAGRTSKGKVPLSWPWADRFWKPSDDPVRNLTKAGALIAAAIDSLDAVEVSS